MISCSLSRGGGVRPLTLDPSLLCVRVLLGMMMLVIEQLLLWLRLWIKWTSAWFKGSELWIQLSESVVTRQTTTRYTVPVPGRQSIRASE